MTSVARRNSQKSHSPGRNDARPRHPLDDGSRPSRASAAPRPLLKDVTLQRIRRTVEIEITHNDAHGKRLPMPVSHSRSRSETLPQRNNSLNAQQRPRPRSFIAYRPEGRPGAKLASSRGLRASNHVNFSRPLSQISPKAMPGELIEQDAWAGHHVKDQSSVTQRPPSPISYTPPEDISVSVVADHGGSVQILHESSPRLSKLWMSLPFSFARMGKRKTSEPESRYAHKRDHGAFGKALLTESNLRDLEQRIGSVPKIYTINLLPTPVHSPSEINSLLFSSPLKAQVPNLPTPQSSPLHIHRSSTPPTSPGNEKASGPSGAQSHIPILRKPLPQLPSVRLVFDVPIKSSHRICEVCKDSKHLEAFPTRATTSRCSHGRNACTDCIQKWIESCMETKGWDHCVCPECVESLEYSDVKYFATEDAFARYDTLSTRAALSTIPNFLWCQSPSCPSGQIHSGTPSSNPVFTCITCSHTYCLNHSSVPFHYNESCAQYDARIAGVPAQFEVEKERVELEKEGEKVVRETAKRCPNAVCGWWIEKNEGCDHMTCWKCRFEFCWECCAAFEPIRRKGNKLHRSECRYYG
ncbi:hypothetical protein CC78DRAFT_164676 [Lojkania enalia]|uniref:RBR-type E3 ubiquitin transferase n=1 Tax=Lojkania enalia TaxID=147567 RepID=A0A9P4KCI9_9PLEO|nr:hypothetical protein CC78DRAFT_164676 [Didymosphaeria enalia]